MIKIALRPNLIYPVNLIVWMFLRQLLIILITDNFNFSNSLMYTILMFLGELLAGITLFFYQKKHLKKNKVEKKEYFASFASIELIQKDEEDEDIDFVPLDSNCKIMVLIFFSAFFDSVEFLIWTKYIPKFVGLSGSFNSRLGGISTVSCSLLYVFTIKLPILRHQKFSLLITGICLGLIIIFELVYQEINVFLSYIDFVIALGLIFAVQIFVSFVDLVDKHLIEYDYMNPFIVLTFEGIFGTLTTLIFIFVGKDYFKDVRDVYKNNDNFALFVFLLFVFLILCGVVNAFRMVTTKLYSPMTRTLTNYFLNPIYLIYNFTLENDFNTNGKRNIPLFIINLIISIIISILGCVYNEFIVLFFCGLEINTHDQISKRSEKLLYHSELKKLELYEMEDDTLSQEDNFLK